MNPDLTPFHASRLARFVTRATGLASQRYWIWPLAGALAVLCVGFWVRGSVERAMKNVFTVHLQSVLNAEVTALRTWFREQQFDAKSFAADARIHAAISDLVQLAQQSQTTAAELMKAEPLKSLQMTLKPLLEGQDYTDFVVVGQDKRILASLNETLIGQTAPAAYDEWLLKALRGTATVSPPFPSEVILPDARGRARAGMPTMMVAAPVLGTNATVLAALALRMEPDKEFSQIFSIGQMGTSGEAYAFDRTGLMLTAGRFEAELKALALLPDRDGVGPALQLRLRDPGADLRRGGHPPKPRDQLGLTKMAAAGTEGRGGIDVHGYRDYRGAPVIGAWAWLPDYEMGVATEVTIEEAYQPLYVLRRAFLVMFGLLVLSGMFIFLFSLAVKQLQVSTRKSALAARRLGQYVLLQEIGAGANGKVYKARHAMLRRAVAVKILDPEKTNESTMARFEREVQVTSQLTHPNTVAIYDYGRTPEGLFYCAMEFLDGLSLDKLVARFGPQTESRGIHILRQVCGSLAEAHDIGLVHRDIKPANIILTRRGGLCDVVKVLDFGLVKAVNHALELEGTVADVVVGTPRYLSPEAIETPERVDARSDLYSVGAVGYLLLTGQPVFATESLKELLKSHVKTLPQRPSERLGKPVAADLENLVMQCLAKEPSQRPQSAQALSEALARCQAAGQWTSQTAEEWWRVNMKTEPVATEREVQEKTMVIAPRT